MPGRTTCLMCRIPLNLSSSNRNLLCEKVITLLPPECSFTEHGCKNSKNIKDTEELFVHEKRCPHRLVRCIHPLCQLLVPVNKLTEHILEASHTLTEVTTPNAIHASEVQSFIRRIGKLENSDSRNCWSVIHIIIDGKFFLGKKHFFTELVREGTKDEGDWIFWVYLLGSEQEAMEYEYTLTLNSAGKTQTSHQYHGSCVSVDKDIETLLKDAKQMSSKYLHISNHLLLSFSSNGFLNLRVEIKKTSHKLPLAVSLRNVLDFSHPLTKSLNHFQSEYATRMMRNVSHRYRQIDKISLISGQASAFERGPYSRSKKPQNKILCKKKTQVITIL